jgi:integrase
MTVYKRSDSPFYLIEFVYKGERHRFSSETTSKAEAQAIEAERKKQLKDEIVNGKLPDMTLEEGMDRYTVEVVKLSKSDGTRELSTYRRIAAFFGADTPLSQITAPRVSEFKRELLEEGLKPASINRYTANLRAILRRAQEEWGVLATVPKISALEAKNGRLRFLDAEEEARLKEHAPVYLRRLITFLIGTGARRGEALKLTWEHVDLGSNTRAAVTLIDTKNGEDRRVPLPNHVRDLLAAMRAEAGRPAKKDRVFTWVRRGTDETVAYKTDPGTVFDRTRRDAKLDDITIHTLRHTYASRLVMKGVPIAHVSKLLGHRKIQITMRYAHLAPEGLDDAVGVLD